MPRRWMVLISLELVLLKMAALGVVESQVERHIERGLEDNICLEFAKRFAAGTAPAFPHDPGRHVQLRPSSWRGCTCVNLL